MMAMLSAHALTTIETLKAELGIPADDTSSDKQLARYINAASDAIRAYCSRDFARAHRTDALQGSGAPTLLLSLYPIVEVHSVKVGDEQLTDFRVDADRKSTRLNSSHVKISYAVFC